MAVFEPGTVVKVPFPYTDRPAREYRPAVIVRHDPDHEHLVWAVMVTSAQHHAWPDDLPIPDHAAAGLPAPSIIRPRKIATLDTGDIALLGALPATGTTRLLETLCQLLGC